MGSGGAHDRTLDYVPALDGIRAVAVGLVLLAHFGGEPFRGGAYGVDIFFVLSGFLITSILLRQSAAGRVNLLGFYSRRLIRLMPALVVVVALTWWPATLLRDAGLVARDSIMSLTYTIAWPIEFGDAFGSHLGHIWSLCVEEWFYLGWPLILLLLLRFQRGIIPPLVAASAAFAIMVLAWRWYAGNGISSYILSGFGIVLGCVLALLLSRWKPRAPWWAGPVAVAIIGAMVVLNGLHVGSVFTRVAVDAAAAILIWALITRRDAFSGLFSARPLVSAGKVSYELYLWHYPLWALLPALFGPAGWWAALIGTFVAAYATHYGLLSLQDRLRRVAPRQFVALPA